MQAAIVQNSSLIKYISKECYIPNELIDLALTNYKITNNDVQFNPDLLNHPRIVESLLHSNNDYEKLIKVLMKQQLLQKFNQFNNDLDISGLENINIPNISKEVFLEFINSYYFKLDEKNVDVQENYFNMLNDVIDGIVNIKYHSSKNKLKYPDILTLHNEMIELFNNDNYEKAEEEVIFAIYDFTGKAINRNDIKSQITILKNYYIENQKLDENVTDKFFNNILNLNRNSFMKFEIRKLHIEIIPKLKLTEKKKQLLVNGKKLKKITDAIENNNLSSLGITDKQFDDQIKTVCYNILNNKKLNKDIQYDSIHNNLKNLAIYYRNTGELSREDTSKILGIDSVKNTDIITKQFNNINYELLKRAKFLDSENVVLDIEKNSIEGINYNNFKIANNKKYLENLIEYLLSSNDHEIKKVLNSNSSIKQIFGMLPIVNLFQEFNLETFKNIVDNFELIMSKINDKKDNFIWKNIDEIILLAESYAAIDEIEVGILGKETIEYIDNKYLPEYISLYKEMLKREYGNIPPVNFATPKYKAASGKFSDSQRLIIGKKPFQKSCMCLENISGKETFIELLTSKNADVVLLNDNNNNLISRVFLFRRGNVLQMVSNAYDNVPLEVYLEISRQIIQQSIDTNDNLDYIFLNDFHLSRKMGQYITIEDERLLSDFPHADFHNFAALINSKEEVLYYSPDTVKLDFKIEPKVEYLKARNKINYNPSDKDINKLRAVYYSLHDNKSKVIEPFVISEYKSVVCGDDWYIAQRFDGSIEELFTSNDFRAHEEYLIVRKSSLNKDYQRIK